MMKRWLAAAAALALALQLAGCSRAISQVESQLRPGAVSRSAQGLSGASAASQSQDDSLPLAKIRIPSQEAGTAPQLAETGHTAVAASALYCRSQLSGQLLTAYDRVLTAAQQVRNFVDLRDLTLTFDQADRVYYSVCDDHPELFYLSIYYSYRYDVKAPGRPILMVLNYFDGAVTDEVDDDLKLTAQADRQVIRQRRQQVEQAVEAFLKKVDPQATGYTKELQAHDYVVARTEYADAVAASFLGAQSTQELPDDDAFGLYGSLVEGKAVCEGYAEAFQYLLQRMGIACQICTGQSKGELHEWNIVPLGGSYYHVDTTWDDTQYIADLGLNYYYYFNLSDRRISATHDISAGKKTARFGPPACSDDSLWYYAQVGIPVDGQGRLPDDEALSARIEKRMKQGARVLFLCFPESWGEQQISDWAKNSDECWRAVDMVCQLGYGDDRDNFSYYVLGEESMLIITL